MMNWWHYLLLVNLYLVVFFIFYKLFLGKETFFQLNRIYLVAASSLSFFIPLIQADWVRNLFITRQIHQTIYSAVNPEYIYQIKPVESTPVTLGQIIAIVYITGAVILLFRLAWQLILLKRIMNSANAPAAFSFFRTLKVDKYLDNQQTIIEHEKVHINQWHSADVLFIETVMIINWFNPAVYLYRKAIKHVHEFIADRKAIENGTSPTEYALLLVSQTFGMQPHQLTNNFFNHSLLKQRIKMLNQDPSNRRALLKYGLSAPLFATMLILSSATVNNSHVIKVINKKTDQAFAINTVNFKNAPTSPVTNKITISNQPIDNQIHEQVLAKEDTLPKNVKVFTAVEVNPQFPGGEAAFNSFLTKTIHYPDQAKANGIGGRVYISFIVEKDGSLSNMKIVRNPGGGLGEEGLRVLALSPQWNPGMQNGKPVRVEYTVPINFAMVYDGKKNGKDSIEYISSVPGKPPVITLTPVANQPVPLYLVNGKAITKGDLNKIKPSDIESINVIKGDSLTNSYGDAGKNGVVLIKLKKR